MISSWLHILMFHFFSKMNGIGDYQFVYKYHIILSISFAFAFGWIIGKGTWLFGEFHLIDIKFAEIMSLAYASHFRILSLWVGQLSGQEYLISGQEQWQAIIVFIDGDSHLQR